MAGGGTAYLNAIPAVEKLMAEAEGDEKTGMQIIARALTAPVKQIAANAGIDGSVVLEKIRESGKTGYGFDAYNEVYCDMIPSGIVDPHQGDPFRSGERRLHRQHPADHRGPGRRQAPAPRSRRSRQPRHGRHVLSNMLSKPHGPHGRGAFCWLGLVGEAVSELCPPDR